MKRTYTAIALIILSLFNLSMYSDEIYGILSDEDYSVLIGSNSLGPALRSVPGTSPYWESYNEWFCFSAERVDLRLSKHELDPPVLVPTMGVWFEDHLYEFEVSSNLIVNNGSDILRHWQSLLEGEAGICVMAAFLQSLDSESSLWILQAVKTQKGYWRESELE